MKSLTFEAATQELQTLIQRLEQGDINLDEVTAAVARGNELIAICQAKLEAVSGAVEEILHPIHANED